MGGILHPRLNIHGGRPIAHKYRKGKMQRTLKRESKELEIVEREAIANPALGASLQFNLQVFGDGVHTKPGRGVLLIKDLKLRAFRALRSFGGFLRPHLLWWGLIFGDLEGDCPAGISLGGS